MPYLRVAFAQTRAQTKKCVCPLFFSVLGHSIERSNYFLYFQAARGCKKYVIVTPSSSHIIHFG